MMKRNHSRLCASAAIAAALALTSTPLLAQVADAPTTVAPEPVLVIPETPAPPPSQPTMQPPLQPTIVLPTELPETPPPATVTTPQPTTTTTTTTTTRTERAAPRAATPPPAREPVAAPADPEPAVTAEEDLAPVMADAVPEAAPIAASEPNVAPVPVSNDGALQFGFAVLAAIAALVLAIWGFVAIGRRKPVDRKAAAIVERPVVTPRAPQPAAVMAEPTPTVTPLATARPQTATPAPSLAHSGASVPLPRAMPATFEERDALMKRMVAARPDRANPFTSPIQRYHRAKLILQSLGRDFGDTEPWIDLSQYPQNWPELARRHAAA
jgi:hypothetical protein